MFFARLGLMTLVSLPLGCATAIPARDLAEAVAGNTFTRQGEYLLSANDQVSVKVYGQDSLSGLYTISPSGVLTFPLIGFVQAAGSTSLQLTERLGRALQSYVKNPIVTVSVASQGSLSVYFSGEFNRPGVASLPGRTSMVQGVALGGGLSKYASGRIVLIRQGANGTTQRYASTYDRLLSGRGELDRLTLERGDVVHAE